MTLMNEFSKLLKNKYFLYFILFLVITNLFGYLVSNNLTAIIFFILVGFLTYQFSKNMIIVLLVALIFTNFIMFNKKRYEGLENNSGEISKIDAVDPDIAKVIPIVKDSTNVDEVQNKINASTTTPSNSSNSNSASSDIIDINNKELNKLKSDSNGPQPQQQSSNTKKGKSEEHFGHRLDYAATIDQSYQHLDNLLGSDSIQQLSKDTQRLMQQQQNLFNTMNQMVPVLEGAQNMLKGFNVEQLFSGLKNSSLVTKG